MSMKMLAAGFAAALVAGFAGAVSAKTDKPAVDGRLFQSEAGQTGGKEFGKSAIPVQKRVGGTTR